VKRRQLRFGRGFRVATGNQRSQAAEMVIAPGKAQGDPDNRHRGADQWLYVLSGRGLMRTLNFYVPPAYDSAENELPAGNPQDRGMEAQRWLRL
jgi:hypothetical protein